MWSCIDTQWVLTCLPYYIRLFVCTCTTTLEQKINDLYYNGISESDLNSNGFVTLVSL